jgi:hypothetical protein
MSGRIEIYTAEPLVPDRSPSKFEIAIAKLIIYNSLCSDHIPPEQIQAECETLRSDMHKVINSILNKEELPDQWKESIIIPILKNGEKCYCSNYRGI